MNLINNVEYDAYKRKRNGKIKGFMLNNRGKESTFKKLFYGK